MEGSVKLSAVILCAGYSSRMGAFKPLLHFGEQTALELLVNTYLQCGIEDIIVVIGYKAEDTMEKLSHLKVKWTINSNYNEGMYSSIKAGVMKIEEDSKGFFLNPVDIPFIKTKTIESIRLEYLKDEKDIIYPLFNGKRGHPPLISTKYNKHILEDASNYGLRNLLNSYAENSIEVPVVDWGIVKDMDTCLDYKELRGYYTVRYVPNEEECSAIWNKYKLPLEIIEHCKTVAFVAYSIGKEVVEAGYTLDLNKIKSAALLHDIARKEKSHAAVGARMLRDLGYNEVADIVEEHMDISSNIQYSESITEKEIVYLADKMVSGKNIISLEERFNKSMKKYEKEPKIIERIKGRFKNCEIIIDKIRLITGGIKFPSGSDRGAF